MFGNYRFEDVLYGTSSNPLVIHCYGMSPRNHYIYTSERIIIIGKQLSGDIG